MDLGHFVTKDKANEGVWFQVELYGKKQPFEVKVLGDDSDVVRKYSESKLRDAAVEQMSKDESFNPLEISKSVVGAHFNRADEDALVRFVGIRSMDKEPLMFGKTELKCNKESYKLLLDKIPALKDFILAKSKERTNFLS